MNINLTLFSLLLFKASKIVISKTSQGQYWSQTSHGEHVVRLKRAGQSLSYQAGRSVSIVPRGEVYNSSNPICSLTIKLTTLSCFP